ncbi:MAG: hypothetical protein ACK4WH_12360 [Phycisphaerales bacterium]
MTPGTCQRVGCKVISTMINHGTLSFTAIAERFTAAVMLRFIRPLVRHAASREQRYS